MHYLDSTGVTTLWLRITSYVKKKYLSLSGGNITGDLDVGVKGSETEAKLTVYGNAVIGSNEEVQGTLTVQKYLASKQGLNIQSGGTGYTYLSKGGAVLNGNLYLGSSEGDNENTVKSYITSSGFKTSDGTAKQLFTRDGGYKTLGTDLKIKDIQVRQDYDYSDVVLFKENELTSVAITDTKVTHNDVSYYKYTVNGLTDGFESVSSKWILHYNGLYQMDSGTRNIAITLEASIGQYIILKMLNSTTSSELALVSGNASMTIDGKTIVLAVTGKVNSTIPVILSIPRYTTIKAIYVSNSVADCVFVTDFDDVETSIGALVSPEDKKLLQQIKNPGNNGDQSILIVGDIPLSYSGEATDGRVGTLSGSADGYIIKSDGTFNYTKQAVIVSGDIPIATSSAHGLMSAADKVKLNSLGDYTLPTASASTLGGVKVGSNLSINNGVLSGAYENATTSAAGLMPSGDKDYLDKLKSIISTNIDPDCVITANDFAIYTAQTPAISGESISYPDAPYFYIKASGRVVTNANGAMIQSSEKVRIGTISDTSNVGIGYYTESLDNVDSEESCLNLGLLVKSGNSIKIGKNPNSETYLSEGAVFSGVSLDYDNGQYGFYDNGVSLFKLMKGTLEVGNGGSINYIKLRTSATNNITLSSDLNKIVGATVVKDGTLYGQDKTSPTWSIDNSGNGIFKELKATSLTDGTNSVNLADILPTLVEIAAAIKAGYKITFYK